jgi:hypothetical protein
MTKILVCWEDRFHDKLDLCLRRVLRRGEHTGALAPELFFDDVRGHGNFEPYVKRDWPKAARHGLPKSGGRIDYLICVADADRAERCCSIEPGRTATAPTAEWMRRANEAWTSSLRNATSLEPEKIFGWFLRWNQESLLIAAHDHEPALHKLGCRDLSPIKKYMRSCNPSPLDITDDLFVEHYRNPARCFDEMLRAAKINPPKKGSVPRDDVLDELSRSALDRLCARVPDLAALAEHLRSLA